MGEALFFGKSITVSTVTPLPCTPQDLYRVHRKSVTVSTVKILPEYHGNVSMVIVLAGLPRHLILNQSNYD
ncbi:hypothetical protein DW095_03200 [Bacteroides sp. AM07-16]|nr:hypothetical protein DW095_03200 [Bacteroides sp. AM07-16]